MSTAKNASRSSSFVIFFVLARSICGWIGAPAIITLDGGYGCRRCRAMDHALLEDLDHALHHPPLIGCA